jgi:queuine tRNA-ribosyltransferase catalytic subunit
VALVPTGTIRLKAKEFSKNTDPVEVGCPCSTCKHYTKTFLHTAFKDNNALAAQLLTKHNISYMMRLMRTMREAILQGPEGFTAFVKSFLNTMFPKNDVPLWVVEALAEAGIAVTTTCVAKSEGNEGSEQELDKEDNSLLKKRPLDKDDVN